MNRSACAPLDGSPARPTTLDPDVHPSVGAPSGSAARVAGAATRATACAARRRPRSTAAPGVAFLAVGLLGLAGCGGGGTGDGRDDGSTLTAADARATGASVESGLRDVAVAVESCFVGWPVGAPRG